MTKVDLINVSLESLRVGDVIPELQATVQKVTVVKVGRTGVTRNYCIELTGNRLLLTHQRVVIYRTPEGGLSIPWHRIEVPHSVGVIRV